jgi:hypothetical protein
MKLSNQMGSGTAPKLSEEQQELLNRGIRFNTVLTGVVMGLGAGLGIFLLTHLSLLVTGAQAGQYLDLLGIILPGYSVSAAGAWFGLLWGFVFGGLSGGFIYYMYARTIGPQIVTAIALGSDARQPVVFPTLRISGHALGTALGCLMALQLYGVTLWLILRGTAHQSPHAALLVNYFPGYSVSYVGGLLGAAYIFAFTYVFSQILAGVYNGLVSKRSQAGE